MILTVTMNPSVDISYRVDSLKIDDVNRTGDVIKTAGGKGLNVARVATQMGQETVATGLLGGHLGAYLVEQLEQDNIGHDFFNIAQESRNCIAILHEGKQTEVLENGPTISTEESAEFLARFKQLLTSSRYNVVTMSGSLPSGMEASVYQKMIGISNQAGIPIILDTSGPNLATVLDDEEIYLKAVKPNLDELSAIEDKQVTEDLVLLKEVLKGNRYSRSEWVIVSLGGDGAFIKHQEDFYRVTVPAIDVVSAVGSGDSTVAGLAVSLAKGSSIEDSIKIAMTAGVLNTLSEKTGSIDMNHFDEIYEQIKIEKFD